MAHSCDFAVVKIAPDPIRDEVLNGAVVVFRPQQLDVCLTPNPERLRTIAPTLHPDGLQDLSASLRALDDPNLTTDERVARLRGVPGISVSDPGTLFGDSESELNKHIQDIVSRLLTAVRAPVAIVPAKSTQLTKELARIFQREKLLARGDDRLTRHKIVRNVAVSSDGSLRADFVAKNRKMHVTETVDLRVDHDLTVARLKDIAVAAMTLDEAKRTFGRSTQRYFIYAGTAAAERQAKGFLQAAEHHAEHTFNFASRDDRARYLDFMFSALRGDLAGSAREAAQPVRKKTVRRAR
jgi:hypothetical protein